MYCFLQLKYDAGKSREIAGDHNNAIGIISLS